MAIQLKPTTNQYYLLDGNGTANAATPTNLNATNIAPYANSSEYLNNQMKQNAYNSLMNYANQKTETPNAMNLNAAPFAAPASSGSAFSKVASTIGNTANAVGTLYNAFQNEYKDYLNQLNQQNHQGQQTVQPSSGVASAAPTSSGSDYMAQLSALLKQQQAEQQAKLEAQQKEKAALVEQAYNRNLENLNNMYNKQSGNLGTIYGNTMDQLEKNYNYSADNVNNSADKALREAYVQNMLAQKNLGQRLNAQGLTGGAAESTIAGLMNNYGNARNDIETQRMSDIANLLNTYQNNASSAEKQYNEALNDLESANYKYQANLHDYLANGVIGSYDDLYSALASGANTYANAMTNLAASKIGNDADLEAAKYKAYVNALAKENSSSNKSSSTTTDAANALANTLQNTKVNSYVNEIKGMSDPRTYLENQVRWGKLTLEEMNQILQAAGLA